MKNGSKNKRKNDKNIITVVDQGFAEASKRPWVQYH